jgi:hypothetical protein
VRLQPPTVADAAAGAWAGALICSTSRLVLLVDELRGLPGGAAAVFAAQPPALLALRQAVADAVDARSTAVEGEGGGGGGGGGGAPRAE